MHTGRQLYFKGIVANADAPNDRESDVNRLIGGVFVFIVMAKIMKTPPLFFVF